MTMKGTIILKLAPMIGAIFAELAQANCGVWHEQEKLYDFESVPAEQKNEVMKKLAILNLQRNNCIDAIDKKFRELITANKKADVKINNVILCKF